MSDFGSLQWRAAEFQTSAVWPANSIARSVKGPPCCGTAERGTVYHTLPESMPEALLIRGQGGREKWVRNTIEMMAVEAKTLRPGNPRSSRT